MWRPLNNALAPYWIATAFNYDLQWRLSGNPFLTEKGALIDAPMPPSLPVTGFETLDDTGGGTSDGRFIAPTGAQVIELGPLNESIHKINEHVGLDELDILSDIYEQILINLLAYPRKRRSRWRGACVESRAIANQAHSG